MAKGFAGQWGREGILVPAVHALRVKPQRGFDSKPRVVRAADYPGNSDGKNPQPQPGCGPVNGTFDGIKDDFKTGKRCHPGMTVRHDLP